MIKAYNNPYWPTPIKWIRVKEPWQGVEGIAIMGVDEENDWWGNPTVPEPPIEVWYPVKIFTYRWHWSLGDKCESLTFKEYTSTFGELIYNSKDNGN